MLDLVADALKLDEFLIALLGNFVNEGSAKVTFSVVKALGLAVVGFAFEARENAKKESPKRKRPRQRNKRVARPAGAKRTRGRRGVRTKK